MRESNMWKRLRQGLTGSRWHTMRVENPALPGTPDVNWCFSGREGWIELKQIKAWPVRSGTGVHLRHYTPEQKLWASDRQAAGGTCHFMLKVGRMEWLILKGFRAASLFRNKPTKIEIINASIKYWHNGLNDEELREVLWNT